MHVSEMRRREDVAGVLAATLASGWSTEFGTSVTVTSGPAPGAQVWRERRPFGAFGVDRLQDSARAYLRDGFRFTDKMWRLPVQWAGGTLAATPAGLHLLAGESFSVAPEVPYAEARLVIPGNLRVRVFDFAAGVVRAMPKTGFSLEKFAREIAVRGSGASGPFPAITRAGEEGTWFEEPLIDAYALPRCPPGLDRVRLARRALDALDAWSHPSAVVEPAKVWAADARDRLRRRLRALAARFVAVPWGPIEQAADALASTAADAGDVITCTGHGDCQPGNVLVRKRDHAVLLIDWEHSSRRSRHYDRLVFALRMRAPRGFSERVASLLADTTSPLLASLPAHRAERAALVAVAVLEDLVWYADESLGEPFIAPSEGLLQYASELPQVVALLHAGVRGGR